MTLAKPARPTENAARVPVLALDRAPALPTRRPATSSSASPQMASVAPTAQAGGAILEHIATSSVAAVQMGRGVLVQVQALQQQRIRPQPLRSTLRRLPSLSLPRPQRSSCLLLRQRWCLQPAKMMSSRRLLSLVHLPSLRLRPAMMQPQAVTNRPVQVKRHRRRGQLPPGQLPGHRPRLKLPRRSPHLLLPAQHHRGLGTEETLCLEHVLRCSWQLGLFYCSLLLSCSVLATFRYSYPSVILDFIAGVFLRNPSQSCSQSEAVGPCLVTVSLVFSIDFIDKKRAPHDGFV